MPESIKQPDLLAVAIKELVRVDNEPRLLVIITHGYVDLMINTLIESKCKQAKMITNDHRTFTHSLKLVVLYEIGVLSEHHYQLLTWFNRLRNDFAHNPIYQLKTDRLSVLADPDHRRVERLGSLCRAILIEMWTMHSDDLVQFFMPSEAVTTTSDVLMVEEAAPEYIIPLKTDPKRVSRAVSDERKGHEIKKAREVMEMLRQVAANRNRRRDRNSRVD